MSSLLKGLRSIFWILGSFLVFYTQTAASVEHSHFKKIELTRINGQIEQLQQNIKQDQQQQFNLQQQLKIAETTISQLSQQIASLNTLLHIEQTKINSLKKEQLTFQKKLSEQRTAIALQLGAAYQLGQSQTLKVILNHKDPNTLSRHLTYYRYLSEARIELISQIRQTLGQLNNNVHEIDEHQQNLKSLLAEKQNQQSQQVQAQQQRQKLISSLSDSVQSKQQQINVLLSNQKALHQLVSKLKIEDIGSSESFSHLRYKLRWPVKGPITAHFGSQLDVGNQHLNGVIIKAQEGTPVRAIQAGKVVFSNWLRGFGMLVILNHSDNYMSLYARNQSIFVKVGDEVKTGDVIATTGSSGGFNKPGLYFEIRQNGQPINPSYWCR